MRRIKSCFTLARIEISRLFIYKSLSVKVLIKLLLKIVISYPVKYASNVSPDEGIKESDPHLLIKTWSYKRGGLIFEVVLYVSKYGMSQ